MLAVCYGAQYLAHFSGGEVAALLEYGRANLSYIKENEVLKVFQLCKVGWSP
jgi:GMP synthase (glutamine-hydrolysing)